VTKTNLITGFLGSGKTTSILHLLANKDPAEKWAVLVNEFGEVGIDGALLSDSGAMIKEIPGGCMCCVNGLPMQVGLNTLLRQGKPDRLLIEPTGLGHPKQILDLLTARFTSRGSTCAPPCACSIRVSFWMTRRWPMRTSAISSPRLTLLSRIKKIAPRLKARPRWTRGGNISAAIARGCRPPREN
jgi:hypothetical protein